MFPEKLKNNQFHFNPNRIQCGILLQALLFRLDDAHAERSIKMNSRPLDPTTCIYRDIIEELGHQLKFDHVIKPESVLTSESEGHRLYIPGILLM